MTWWRDLFPQVAELEARVKAAGGYVVLTAGEVRDICGFQRLGIHIRERRIPFRLNLFGLDFIPGTKFPGNQNDIVVIYKKESRIGWLISVASGSASEIWLALRQLKAS